MTKEILETRLISSLEKVFLDEELYASVWDKGSMLNNEVYSFQIAYRIHPEASPDSLSCNLKIGTDGELAAAFSIRQ
ncbi:MAG: hypothetical protein PHP79_10490, partial [Clostridia bacterium]|nr:hypothetical protein [Clostridia bacterium]